MFNGNRTLNSIRQAESQVFGAREQLRNTEQNTLLSGLTAYMDVLEDTAILGLDNNNVDVLKEQLRETRDRFTVGEVTRTDVAQAEASLAQGQGTALSAVATLQAAVARYRQFIGDQPTSLAPVKPLVRPIPKTLPEAISISQIEHPAISGSLHGVDAAELQVKIAEGALYPTIGLSASFTNQYDVKRDARPAPTVAVRSRDRSQSRSIRAERNMRRPDRRKRACPNRKSRPIPCATRSARPWSPPGASIEAAVGVVRAARASVSANEVALTGVREEAKVGQRTTLDVLNAQQALLQARTTLVQAEHDQVVNSYSLLSAMGRLNIPTLGLAVAEYDPRVHFDQVKSKWIGLRTPSGQ